MPPMSRSLQPPSVNTFLKRWAHERECESVIRKCGNSSHTSSEKIEKQSRDKIWDSSDMLPQFRQDEWVERNKK